MVPIVKDKGKFGCGCPLAVGNRKTHITAHYGKYLTRYN
jgi:hypothetical protein